MAQGRHHMMRGLRALSRVGVARALEGSIHVPSLVQPVQRTCNVPLARVFLPITGTRTMATQGLEGAATSTQAPAVTVKNLEEALHLLKMQPNHYVVASIAGRTFVLSSSDVITVPRLPGVKLGDILELDLVHEVGSRDFTLRAQDPAHGARNPEGGRFPLVLLRSRTDNSHCVRVRTDELVKSEEVHSIVPFSSSWAAQLIPTGMAHVGAALSSDVVQVQCVVIEHAKGPLERIEKFKRRKGYDKVITHKQPYTRIRVDTIKLGPRERSL